MQTVPFQLFATFTHLHYLLIKLKCKHPSKSELNQQRINYTHPMSFIALPIILLKQLIIPSK